MKSTWRHARLFALLALVMTPLLALTFTLPGPQVRAQEELPEPSTTLRFMHVAESGAVIDVSVDGENLVRRMRFGEVSQYVSVAPGDHEFSINVGEEAEPIIVTQTIESGDAATVLLIDGESGIEVQAFEVNLDRTDTGEARIRLINASTDAGNLDLYSGEDRWAEGVEFANASDYEDIGWGEYDLAVRAEDADEPIAEMPGIELNWGNVYDVVTFGSHANGSLQTLTLVTTVSPRCTLLQDVKGLPSDACLRIGNLAPSGLPIIDVYYNHVRILENVGLGDRINYVAVPVFDYEVPIHIVPAGMGTDYSSTYRYVTLRPGEAYEMFIVGSANSPSIVGERVNLTPPPVGQGRWRLLQGYPDAQSVDVVIKDGPVLFEDVEFKDVTDYVVLDAGPYTIQILDHESGTVLYESDVVVESGMVYDSVVSFSVEVTVDPSAATPVSKTGSNAMIITFSSPTFPRGGILVPSPLGDLGADDAVATPEA